MSRGLDWPWLLRAGLRHGGLAPCDFWRMTPVELLVRLGLDGGPPGMARARLDELARAYPDAKENDDGRH